MSTTTMNSKHQHLHQQDGTKSRKRPKRPRSCTEEYRYGQSQLSYCCLLPSIIFLFLISGLETIPVNGYSFYNTNNLGRSANYKATTRITTAKTKTTRLYESREKFPSSSDINTSTSSYYEGNGFPSMMDKLNDTQYASTTQNVITSNGPGFVSTNGVSEKINGYEYKNNYLQSLELEERSAKEQREKDEEEEEEEEKKRSLSRQQKTVPEINNWTSIMKRGLFFQKKKKVETVDMVYKELRDMSKYDCDQVDVYWDLLLPAVSYLGTERVVKVRDALRVAYRAHRGQARKSGEPFIIHPVEVSLLLAGLKMDESTVMAGLLHDTVEDTDLSFELVEDMFGKTVRQIVEGETKVSKLPKIALTEYADEQAENLRQMFVAMTDDYRIIIVKLADRLHNMRTLRHMKPEKQIKISRETLDIFAPLAHRMGIWQFKSELEDTAFMYLYPQEYKRLNRRLSLHQTKFEDTLDKSQQILTDRLNSDPTLRDQAASVKVSGRMKEIYSLWHKMETKGERNLDQIVDVVALRVIIDPKINPDDDENDSDRGVWLCYHVLGVVQHLVGFQPVPTRVKDYISFPKPNGYQSLHTALMLNGQKIEVQIRTRMMHQVAEFGMASHWSYTGGKRRQSGNDDIYNTPWLSSIKEWQNEKLDARDFVDSVRSELLGKRVFVFLRNGKILNLARGATAIDAAFTIHSEVGLHMHGVEINGKAVSISYELQNGDVVSILTGEGRPSTDWIKYAKSRSTRSKLRSYFRVKQKESLREAGKIILMDYLWMHGPLIEKSSYIEEDFSVPTTIDELAALLPGNTQYDDIDDLFLRIGKQHDRVLINSFVSKLFKVPQKLLINAEKNKTSLISTKNVLDAVYDRAKDAADAAASAQNSIPIESTPETEATTSESDWPKPSKVEISDEKADYADPEHLCMECLPVYGDDIIGTRPENHTNDAIPKVHRTCCPVAQRAIHRALAGSKRSVEENGLDKARYQKQVDSVSLRRGATDRVLESPIIEVPVKLKWSSYEPDEEYFFNAEIVVHCEDRKLLLADCSEIVSDLSEIVKTGSLTTNEHATLAFLIKIRCLDDLQKVMNSLRKIPSVMAVERRFGSEL